MKRIKASTSLSIIFLVHLSDVDSAAKESSTQTHRSISGALDLRTQYACCGMTECYQTLRRHLVNHLQKLCHGTIGRVFSSSVLGSRTCLLLL